MQQGLLDTPHREGTDHRHQKQTLIGMMNGGAQCLQRRVDEPTGHGLRGTVVPKGAVDP